MKCRLEKIYRLSGEAASTYTLRVEGSSGTLFEQFIKDGSISFKDETLDILKRLKTIAFKTGAREDFFKLHEGIPGDGVCALFDRPNSNLRLYCIRFGLPLIILGGGGHKPKSIKKWQEKEDLANAVRLLINLSAEITLRIKGKELIYTNNFLDLEGDMEFDL